MYHSSLPPKISKQFQEIYSLPPNDLHNGILTAVYKMCTAPLKRMPFVIIVPFSIVAILMGYVVFGTFFIRLVSLLQHGF